MSLSNDCSLICFLAYSDSGAAKRGGQTDKSQLELSIVISCNVNKHIIASGKEHMKQNYGALRVLYVRASTQAPAEATHTQGRWLPTEGLVQVITRRDSLIGRAPSNDIILQDPTVSREHAGLLLTQDGWRVVNLTERNSVRVNGRRVPGGESMPINPQDILVVGNTMLQLVAPSNHHILLLENEPTVLLENVALPETAPPSNEGNSKESVPANRPLSPLPAINEEEDWSEERPENILGAGVTMQFVLPQRVGLRTRWLIAGIGIAIFLISAIVTLLLSSSVGRAALEQNGLSTIVTAVTIPLFPAVGIFLLVNFMDRFEREPWFLRLAAFLWGAFIAIPPTFFIEQQVASLLTGWMMSSSGGNDFLVALAQGLNAGITEETMKGLGLILLFFILRDEFDNVTDGIIYAALIGAGFAMVENFDYFALNGHTSLGFLILSRIILGWLAHSTFLACLGAGLGYVRHTRLRWRQVVVPLLGYLLAVGLHSLFDCVDFLASILASNAPANSTTNTEVLIIVLANYIPLFLAQVGLISILIKSLAHEVAVIREFLSSEVGNGIVLIDEYVLLQNSFQRTRRERQMLRSRGVRTWLQLKTLYQTEIGLAFRKWHVSMGDKPKLGYLQPEDAYRTRIRRLRNALQTSDALSG
jgi:RsiW-degrading membrane proteinase PrsW (M82 family)